MVKIKLLQKTIDMHNFYAKYAKIFDICKRFSKKLNSTNKRNRVDQVDKICIVCKYTTNF